MISGSTMSSRWKFVLMIVVIGGSPAVVVRGDAPAVVRCDAPAVVVRCIT